MAIDVNSTSSKQSITPPDQPRSRPSEWLRQTKGNVRMAAVLFYCAEHVWLTYYGGRRYLSECRLAGIEPDTFGWTAEDTTAQRRLMFVDFAPTDPLVSRYIDEFVAAVPQEYVLRLKRGIR